MAMKGTFERNGLPAVNRSTTASEFGKIRTYRPNNYTDRAHGENYSDASS